MADPTPTPKPTRLSLQDRQLLADTLQAQNPIARDAIYRRLEPEDETWVRAALNDAPAPSTAAQIRSGVTTGLETAGRYARDNPVKTGAMIGGTVLPMIATGGASVPAQIALAGAGGFTGAGLGALTGTAYGAPEVMQPSMRTIPGVASRMGTEGLGQAVAAGAGHGIGAALKGSANILQRAGLPDALAKDFPTLAETLNQYRINPTTASGLARAKILRKGATGGLRDVVDAGIARGERGIVQSDLAPYMRPSLTQAREEAMIAPSEGRAIIRKTIDDLMGQQPLGTFPRTPPGRAAGGGSVGGATGTVPSTALAEGGPTITARAIGPGALEDQPSRLVPQDEPVPPTGLARRVIDAEIVPDTPPTVSNLPPGAVPNGGGIGPMPPTTYQEPEIPLRRMAPIRRQLFGRAKDVIRANALGQRADQVGSLAYGDLANAVGQEADQRMPGWLDANKEIQRFQGAVKAAKDMQTAKTSPGRVMAAAGVAAPLAGGTYYESHNPLETAAAFTLPFALMSPASTARTAMALYQAGRIPFAQLLQVATPEMLQQFGLTEKPVTSEPAQDVYSFLDQEAK